MGLGRATGIKEFPWPTPPASSTSTREPGSARSGILDHALRLRRFPRARSGAVESLLTEGKIIGLAWAVIDYDDVNAKGSKRFLESLTETHHVWQRVRALCIQAHAARAALQPKAAAANGTWQVVDMDRRRCAVAESISTL